MLRQFCVHGIKLLGLTNYRYSKCSYDTCRICPFVDTNHFLKWNDFYLPFQSYSNCKSVDIIYIIHCKLCHYMYIGQSGSLRKRMSTHIRGCILNNKDFSSCVCVVNHFNQAQHSTFRDFEFYVFKIDISCKWKRLNLETQLIQLAIRLNINLMNIQIPDPLYWKRSDKLFEIILD